MAVEVNWIHALIILAIFVLTYIGIMVPKIDKTMAAMVGALAASVVIVKLAIPDPNDPGHYLTEESLVHFEDLKILGLIIGTLIIVDITQESGVFHYLSIKILKATEGDPKKLLRYLSALTILLSAMVNNISAMMIVGSLTLIACERLKLNPKPYIITELSMTTVGGIITLISSVPNVIISQIFGISFLTFFLIGGAWGIVLMVVTLLVFEFLFKDVIRSTEDPLIMKNRVAEFDEWGAVKDRRAFWNSIIVLGSTIIAFAFSSQLGLSLALIALIGGVIQVILSRKKLDDVFSRLDWNLVAFFLGLFVIIAALDVVHVLEFIADWLAHILPSNPVAAAIILLWVTAAVSAIVDNIVVAAAFGPILFAVATESSSLNAGLIAWSAIFGANFGGGITPIGAPSAVVGIALLYRRTGEKIGWGEFIRTQGFATFVRIFLTMFYLWFLFLIL